MKRFSVSANRFGGHVSESSVILKFSSSGGQLGVVLVVRVLDREGELKVGIDIDIAALMRPGFSLHVAS